MECHDEGEIDSAWAVGLPCAWASWPFEIASAVNAAKNATSIVSASGIGRETRASFMSGFLSVR